MQLKTWTVRVSSTVNQQQQQHLERRQQSWFSTIVRLRSWSSVSVLPGYILKICIYPGTYSSLFQIKLQMLMREIQKDVRSILNIQHFSHYFSISFYDWWYMFPISCEYGLVLFLPSFILLPKQCPVALSVKIAYGCRPLQTMMCKCGPNIPKTNVGLFLFNMVVLSAKCNLGVNPNWPRSGKRKRTARVPSHASCGRDLGWREIWTKTTFKVIIL